MRRELLPVGACTGAASGPDGREDVPALVLGRSTGCSSDGDADRILPARGCSATGEGCLRGDDGPDTFREWEVEGVRDDGTGGVPVADCEARDEDVERVLVR